VIRERDLQDRAVASRTLANRPAAATTEPTITRPELEEALEVLNEPKLTIQELAQAWRVRPETVLRDIRKGALPAHRLPGGDWRILLSDARRYGRPNE
jgi:excisionase family DNA binding protein